jgi:hypothetical protein
MAITLSLSFCLYLAITVAATRLAAGAYQYLKQHHVVSAEPLSTAVSNSVAASDDPGAEHFSPTENLERLELGHLKAAAGHALAAKRSLDIAIMRIYRDGEQYENEERNATRFRDQSTTAMFRDQRNIHVRVKAHSPNDLMHLKAWSDGEVLREGSANWSLAALKRQDNNVRFSRNLNEVKAFEVDFEAMWNRASNTIVQ